jgi:hypothetical protein
MTQTLLILTFPCLSEPSTKAKESCLNLPRQLTQIDYPIGLPRITRALPECLTRPPYPDSTRVLIRALPKQLTRSCTPYPALPIALPGRVTPYQLCPRSFTRDSNLPSLSLVDPTLSLSAKFGLHFTRPTTCFYLYRPLTQFGFPGR